MGYAKIAYHWKELIIYNQTSKWVTQNSFKSLENTTIDLMTIFILDNKPANIKNIKLLAIFNPKAPPQCHNYPSWKSLSETTEPGELTQHSPPWHGTLQLAPSDNLHQSLNPSYKGSIIKSLMLLLQGGIQ